MFTYICLQIELEKIIYATLGDTDVLILRFILVLINFKDYICPTFYTWIRFNSNLNSLLPGPLQNSMLKYKAMPTIPSCLKQIVEQPQARIARTSYVYIIHLLEFYFMTKMMY